MAFSLIWAFQGSVFADDQKVIHGGGGLKQVPLAGEIKQQTIPNEFFYEGQNSVLSEKTLLTAGYLVYNDHPTGYVTGVEEAKETALTGDTVYLSHGADAGIRPGNRYYIYTKSANVLRPGSKDDYGYIVTIVGVVSIVEVKAKSSLGIVKAEYQEIRTGNSFMPEFSLASPKVDPDRPLANKSVKGVIMAVNAGKESISFGDMVYLSVGGGDGVAESDIFEVTEGVPAKGQPGAKELPRKLGKLRAVVVRFDSTTAVVVSSKSEIRVGDKVSYIQER
ncbi:MAG: hypothetical protein HY280_03620 [Nitrospinae bacterium]|nr:hypothetical protein [Nitrospinota bacterium]